MNCETTTCISHEHLHRLKQYSLLYNLSVSELITLLVRFAAQNKKMQFIGDRKIQYRERRGKDSWKRLHIVLKPFDYEIFLDAKKLFKMSVAMMIEFCIDNFLFECIENTIKKQNTDNYLYGSYHYEFTTEDGIDSYHVYWGIPLKILKIILMTQQLPRYG